MLPRSFYERNAVLVARELLGMRLVRQFNETRLSGMIVETEAYRQDDTACHAHRGMTKRNAVMFATPGLAYVYFTYGMHYMLNVVSEPQTCAAAVLLRAIQPLEGIETMRQLRSQKGVVRRERDLTSGPAKLTQALAIDKAFNEHDLVKGSELWIEQGEPIPDEQVATGPRIGIGYATEGDILLPWRFWLHNNTYVSR